MITEAELQEIARKALQDLAELGQTHPTGAVLGSRANRIASEDGLDFKSELKRMRHSLLTLVETLPDVTVQRRPETDFIVRLISEPTGTAGADKDRNKPSSTAIAKPLRKDIFDAFTFARSSPYYYYLSTDTFSNRLLPGEQGVFPVPSLSINDLIVVRARFADTLVDASVRNSLLSALGDPATPLRSFSNVVRRDNVLEQWNSYHRDYAEAAARKWASESGLDFKEEWFSRESKGRRESARSLIIELSRSATEEELSRIQVPLLLVQKILSRYPR